MQLEPQPLRIFFFSQTNPLTQPGAYEGNFSFKGGLGGIKQPPTGVNGNKGVTPFFKQISFKPFQICRSIFVHYGRPINI